MLDSFSFINKQGVRQEQPIIHRLMQVNGCFLSSCKVMLESYIEITGNFCHVVANFILSV